MSSILETKEIKKYFSVSKGLVFAKTTGNVKAVDGVNLTIAPGETLGMVGESGCGKTTLARLILLLEQPTSGCILFEGKNLQTFSREELAHYRKSVQVVFQNPFSALNPRMRVGSIISEPLTTNTAVTKNEVKERITAALEAVGLNPDVAANYPHQFSGGQRQRIAIARALACNPRLIVLDEPVSSQDVSIQAQLLNLLKDLQRDFGLSFLFIGHDLATVRFMSHRVIVMYLGQIVENAPVDDLCNDPLHPYTKALLDASLPDKPDSKREKKLLSGEVPSPVNPPTGCRFHTRCPVAMPECATIVPELKQVSPTRSVSCLLTNNAEDSHGS